MSEEELDLLIDAALIDGTISEKEKQILCRKAKEMGIDEDEFELQLNAQILKKQRSTTNKKSSKLGEVRKCPSCGAQIGSFLMKCPECGYEFSGVGPNKYVADFSAALSNIEKEASNVSSGLFDIFESGEMKDDRKHKLMLQKEARLVKNYPSPMTKEDSLEMLYFMLPKTKFAASNKATYAWRSKFFEILARAERYGVEDKNFSAILAQMRKDAKINMFAKFAIWWKSLTQKTQVLLCLLIFYILFGIFFYHMLVLEGSI